MDKLLSDKQKDNNAGKREEVKPIVPTAGSVVSGAPAYIQELTFKNLEKNRKNKALNATPQGRAAIRLFSRGLMGAAFFAAGGYYAKKTMGGYSVEKELELAELPKKPLQWIARGIDKFIGTPIKWAWTAYTGSAERGERAVRFRPMSSRYSGPFNNVVTGGQSLGQEMVSVTFDFFSASVGDALGRDIVDNLDPNYKKKIWQDEKGNTSLSATVKNVLSTGWRYISYNGGEDWAVALPYVYFMKAQRSVLNGLSPGFRFDACENLNGSSFKVDQHANIIGTYNLVGAIDLQSRFTVYNMGTLMYREAYNWARDKLQHRPTALYGSPDKPHEVHGVLGHAEYLAKWAARSVLKGAITMTPAVPFFWITRTPQTKYKSTFINPADESMLTYVKGTHALDGTLESGLVKGLLVTRTREGRAGPHFTEHSPVAFGKYTGTIEPGALHGWKQTSNFSVSRNPFRDKGLNLYGKEQTHGAFSRFVRPFGEFNERVRTKFRLSLEPHIRPEEMSRFINASISYTPYMYMKAETARLWDDGKMDMAAERMIDGAFDFNMREFKTGAKEVWRSILHQSLGSEERDREAARRREIDTSASDAATQDQIKSTSKSPYPAVPSSWRQRVIQGRPPEEAIAMAKAEKHLPEKHVGHAEQEAMRKALEAFHPPTNSIH